MSQKQYRSNDLIRAIAKRHTQDIFCTEVKDGPTVFGGHSRIDALAMKISWTNFGIIGYEVKVSRSDFMRDEKWRAYLPMCNQLYFAVAPGTCELSEIPECCGLVVLSPSGGLRTAKKAPWRNIDPPISMYQYLMFNYIGPYWQRDRANPRGTRLLPNENHEFWRTYLDEKADMRDVGRHVGRKLRNEMEALRRESGRMSGMAEEYRQTQDDIRAICLALEVTGHWQRAEKCLAAIDQLKSSGGMSASTMERIKQLCVLSSRLAADIGAEAKP